MGNLPTTHHDHTAQGKQPVYKDTSLTTSRPAPHESAHEAFGTMELNEPRKSCPLHKRSSNSEKTLDVTIWLIVLRFLLISLSYRGAHLIVSVYLI